MVTVVYLLKTKNKKIDCRKPVDKNRFSVIIEREKVVNLHRKNVAVQNSYERT